MLDPNPLTSGKGQRKLREADIVTDLFPWELMAEVETLKQRVRARTADIGLSTTGAVLKNTSMRR